MSAKSKSSHILKKSPKALTYSKIVEGVTESNRSFMKTVPNNANEQGDAHYGPRSAKNSWLAFRTKS